MRLIWLLVILFIGYGSLFPFNFDFSRQWPSDIGSWLLNWEQRTIRSDLIANVLLFIPFGFFGALTIQQDNRRSPLLSILLMILGGIVYALLLQGLQFFLPSRVPHAADAVINLIGILVGVALAAYTNSQRIKRLLPQSFQFHLAPALVLLVLWIGWAFFPYMPVFESEQLGKGIEKIYQSSWQPQLWFQHILFWLVFYYSLQRVLASSHRLGFLISLSLFILVVKLAMFRSQLGWSEISALPVALLLFHQLSESWQLRVLSLGALSLLVWQSLIPWQWQTSPSPIQWLPFKGFLQGSTWYNLSSLIEYSLLLATLGYALGRALKSYHRSAALLVIIVIIISGLQLFVANKTADISHLILAIGIGLLLARVKNLRG